MAIQAVAVGAARAGKAVAGTAAKAAKAGSQATAKTARAGGKAAARRNPVVQNRLTKRLNRHPSAETQTLDRYGRQIQQPGRSLLSPKKLLTKQGKVKKNRLAREIKRVKAAGIAVGLSLSHLPFFGIQFCLALLYVASVYIIDETVFDVFLPIKTLSYIAQALIFIIGVLAMAQAWTSFMVARVDIFNNASFITFGVLTFCYMIPYLGFIPLMIIWVWLVVWFQ